MKSLLEERDKALELAQQIQSTLEEVAQKALRLEKQRNELLSVLIAIVNLDNDAHPGLSTWMDARTKAHEEAIKILASYRYDFSAKP